MYLFWLVDADKTHYYSNYCRSWELALDCFVYIPLTIQRSGYTDYQAYKKSLDNVLARCPVESEVDLYLAGSDLMLQIFTDGFSARGTPFDRIKLA